MIDEWLDDHDVDAKNVDHYADLDTPAIQDRFVSGYRSVREVPADSEQRSALHELREWRQTFSNLQPDLDTTEGRGATVERHARTAFEAIIGA